MTAYVLPILATVALWWASTGLILFAHSLAQRTFVYSMAAATACVGFAIWGLVATGDDTRPMAAYAAFSYGLTCWAWQIVTYFTGYVTGPRKTACPPDLRGLPRFVEAVRASLYHELASLIGAVVLLALTSGKPNQLAVWTYLLLWWMHASAKLNLFFGVPNLGAELLPRHLAYLESFMARRPMNLFFPFSVTISTVATLLLAQRAADAHATRFESIGFTMLATLMALAVLEHWFLVAPMNGNALWGASSRRTANAFAASLEEEFSLLDASAGIEETASSPRWSAALPALGDARALAQVLELVAAGSFGEIDSLKGAMRTQRHWLAFEIANARARIAPFEPRQLRDPVMHATGRSVDRARLRAAFERCAV